MLVNNNLVKLGCCWWCNLVFGGVGVALVKVISWFKALFELVMFFFFCNWDCLMS